MTQKTDLYILNNMKIIYKNISGKIGMVRACESFPTFIGDKFSLANDSSIVTVVDIIRGDKAVKEKVVVKESVEQMTLF